MAIQPCYDTSTSEDFHEISRIHADLTRAYKNVRLASKAEKGLEVSVSPETAGKLAPQGRHSAQKPGIDVGKTSEAAAAKALAAKFLSFHAGISGDASQFDLYIIFLKVAFLVISVDNQYFSYITQKRKEENDVWVKR